MSDCSTKAMAHKELPRTCGNCGHACGHRTKLYGCAYDYVPCLLHGTFEHEANLCSDWEQRADTLEQRCEQLEQVARDMLRDFKKAEGLVFSGLTSSALDLIAEASRDYQRDLEALGVSVDGS